MPFIVMLLTDKENIMILDNDDTSKVLLPKDYVANTYPYSDISQRKGYKTKFKVSREKVANEITRRNPSYKINWNNKKLEDLRKILAQYPITDESDLELIKKEDEKFRLILENQLAAEEEDPQVGTGRIRDIDRLRFVVILCTEEKVTEAYLASTNSKDREEVEYQKSDKAEPSWSEMLCELTYIK